MRKLPRKTATFTMDTKEKSIIEAQKYEIDKKQIYDFYGIIPKKERVYNVIKKQIAFGKDSAFKNIDKNKKYSNYLVFRALLQKEYDIEDIKSEIEQVKLLINFSENTRDEFYRFFHFDRADYIKSGEGQAPTQLGIGMKGDAIYSSKNSDESRKRTMNDLVLSANDFIRKCKMLRRKREENGNADKTKTFKIYSDLNKPSNKFAAMDNYFSNKNKLNNKYYLQKESLIRCFNREERFINFNHLIKESYIKEAPDSLTAKTKDKYSSKYFDIIFGKREEKYYEDKDKFFSKYNITSFKLKDEEADFYGKIYGILCKNYYMKFLSFLYSKNDIFKFIYDEFSDKDAIITNFSLESSLASQIQTKLDAKSQSLLMTSESFSDNKIRQKELGISTESNKKNNEIIEPEMSEEDKEQDNDRKNNFLEQIPNCYSFMKIGFLNKIINENNIIDFYNGNEDEEDNEEEEKKNDPVFFKYLKECSIKPMDDYLLIDMKKNLKIFDKKYNSLLEGKKSKIVFFKINKDDIKTIDIMQMEYYLFQKKKEKEYYLFKIDPKFINTFEDQIKDNLDLKYLKEYIAKKDKKDKKKKKEKEKGSKKTNKEKEKENSENSSKNKEKEKNKDKGSEDLKEGSKKSESSEKKSQKLTPISPKESFSSGKSEKSRASILNPDSSEDSAPEKIQKVIKNSNMKNTSKYQSEHKNYEFMIDNIKYSFDIIKGELRCKPYNKQMFKYSLTEISPQKVEEDKEHSCYKLEIKKGKKIIFTILNEDKVNLENFYFDLKK